MDDRHIGGHWRQGPWAGQLAKGYLVTESETSASPLDALFCMGKYWTPFAADAAFGAEHDCYNTAWHGCSQAYPISDDNTMHTTVRWAMALALTTRDPVMTLVHVARICLHQMTWPSSGACSAGNQSSPQP